MSEAAKAWLILLILVVLVGVAGAASCLIGFGEDDSEPSGPS